MSPFFELFAADRKPIIGMVHLQPLAGSPHYQGDDDAIRQAMLNDASALIDGGVDALMIENFGDAPFLPRRVPACVVAQMTALACAVRAQCDLPIGINVLRNDGRSALAVAHAANCQFIRVNVLCGARVTDQGIIEGIAHDLLRDRNHLGATGVAILADVNVKHSAPLGERPIDHEVGDMVGRGGADCVIVSGGGTGQPTDPNELAIVKHAGGQTPVLVGSGVNATTIAELWPHADGFIVGSALKTDGAAANPVDPQRVNEFMQKVAECAGA